MSKVLLVEDDPAESRLYQRLLTAEGFDMVAIDNGQECHAAAVSFRPDIILMDIMMPKMNGFEALDILRIDKDLKMIPVVVLSNLSDDHYKEEAHKRGAVQFIIKSQIENKDLIGVIRDVLTAYTRKGGV